MAKATRKVEDMSDQSTGTVGGEKKRRKPQGPRKPSPLYAFVRLSAEGKPELATSFRDPRKMAEYFPTATSNGEHLLIIAPEA